MPSDFSSIGFPVETKESLRRLVEQGARYGERISAPRGGAYYRWSPGGGAEVWVQVNPKGELFGMHPHFTGAARMRASLTGRVPDDRGPLDGAFWQEPCDAEMGCPFVFNVPDYACCSQLKLPAVVELQLAAFARELMAYATDAEFAASQRQRTDWKGWAPESFVPSGTFKLGDGLTVPPKAEAILAGHVLETGMATNGSTRNVFQWARIRTFGAVLDVVADPAILEGTIVPGGVVFGTFWLSGRVPDYQPPANHGLLGRLFGKE